MDVFLLCMLCVVRYRSLRLADHSSRGILPTVVRRCVWSRKPREWGGPGPLGTVAPKTHIMMKASRPRSVEPSCLSHLLKIHKIRIEGGDFFPSLRPHELTTLVGQGLLIVEASRSHSDTQHSTRDRHSCTRRNSNPKSHQASGRRPSP